MTTRNQILAVIEEQQQVINAATAELREQLTALSLLCPIKVGATHTIANASAFHGQKMQVEKVHARDRGGRCVWEIEGLLFKGDGQVGARKASDFVYVPKDT